jgi:hypothetical protein
MDQTETNTQPGRILPLASAIAVGLGLMAGGTVPAVGYAAVQGDQCVINLDTNSHTCQDLAAISFISQPANHQAVTKITLDPASGYKKVIFDVTYNTIPTGWTVDICDSQSCNGWGGDAGHTSNAAEVEVVNTSFNAYRNTLHGHPDATGEPLSLFGKAVSITEGSTVSLEISDERVGWDFPNEQGELVSDRLFTLNGQIPTYGTVDYDIYAAFNRVISGTSRNGSGAGLVRITLVTTESDEKCEGHAHYDVETGILNLPMVDMATIPALGGFGRGISSVIGSVEVDLSLIPGSNLFEIKQVLEATPADPDTLTVPPCHAEYRLESQYLTVPKVDIDVVSVINGVPVKLGTDTLACELEMPVGSDLFKVKTCGSVQ